jgi:hypothetical protein
VWNTPKIDEWKLKIKEKKTHEINYIGQSAYLVSDRAKWNILPSIDPLHFTKV